MKSYLMLAVKELKKQKVTTILILIAVILSSIMTTTIGQSLGILKSMRINQASSLNGDRYATFHQLSEQQMSELSSDSRLYDVGSLINVGNSNLENSGLTLFLREYIGDALDAYPTIRNVKEGCLPTAPNEIALPENVLKYLSKDVHVGSIITLDAEIGLLLDTAPPYKYSAKFKVCGILESNYVGYATGSVDAIVGNGTANALLPERYLLYSTDFKVYHTNEFQSTIDDLARTLGVKEKCIQYNWILLDALGISYEEAGNSDTDTGFSFMAVACIMVGVLVLFAAGLVIYNILKITIAKNIKEYGTLRAIGAERGQIYRIVSIQLLILCSIGIPIGLLIGVLSAKGILIAATSILNPDLFMVNSTRELNTTISRTSANNPLFILVSVTITLAFAMLATFPAARYASYVSPTVAISGQTTKITRRVRRTYKIRNFEAYYARLNLKRGRGRTAITILSLVMSITVFVALQSFSTILDTSRNVKDMHLGDYAITSEIVGITQQSIEQIRENPAVADLATTKLSLYTPDESGVLPVEINFHLQSGETFQVAGIDTKRLSAYAENLSEKNIQDLIDGKACLVKNPIAFSYEGQTTPNTNFEIGDMIVVNGINLKIVGLVETPITINNDGFTNGVQVLVNDEVYNKITNHYEYSEIYPTLHENANVEEFENWLDNWCNSNLGSHWISYQQSDAQLEESFEQINMLCWGLIFFIGLIGILNIINTVYSNIHTRVSEIGMQRAIGMSGNSLYKTFLWEGAYYGIIASIAGGILGYICTIFVNAATADALQLVPIPYISIIEAAFFSIVACLLATAIPLHSISKMNIVESIEMIE